MSFHLELVPVASNLHTDARGVTLCLVTIFAQEIDRSRRCGAAGLPVRSSLDARQAGLGRTLAGFYLIYSPQYDYVYPARLYLVPGTASAVYKTAFPLDQIPKTCMIR